ncbi:Uncharacterised protein [Mycobacteroides abscessus subsp. abscessus]|nr:Uncharacterised protein [Mycobacteroides abscessus subsp. abscessus]
MPVTRPVSSVIVPLTLLRCRTSTPCSAAFSSRIWSNFMRSTWYAYDPSPANSGEMANKKFHGTGFLPQRKLPPRLCMNPAFLIFSSTPRSRHTP